MDPLPEVGGRGEWFDVAAGETCRVVAVGRSVARSPGPGTIGSPPPMTSTGCRMSVRNGRLLQLAAAASRYG